MKTADYRITSASGPVDNMIISDMHAECFPGADVYPISGSHWWIARNSKGVPAAFAGLNASTLEGGGFLCRAGVLPAHRGNGLQVRLIRVREALARSMDLNFLISNTIENPVSANHLIECGFRLFDPITPWDEEPSLYWRKELR